MITSAVFPRQSIPQRLVHGLGRELRGYTGSVTLEIRSLAGDSVARLLLLAVVVAQLLDAFTTIAGINAGASEMNPLNATLISAFGFGGLIGAKVVVVAITGFQMARIGGNWARGLGAVAALISFAVVAWNVGLSA